MITLANGKGGSGKTSCALLLAATVADVSGRCLLVDTDSQGSASEVCAAAGDSLPFEYAAEGDRFTITVPPPPGEKANPGNSWKYVVTLAK